MCYETCCYEKMNDWYTHYFLTPIYKTLKEKWIYIQRIYHLILDINQLYDIIL